MSISAVNFIVKNNSSIRRSITVFNVSIGPGNQLDLMQIPGITEEDIRTELTKGFLKQLIAGGSLTIVSSTVNLSTADNEQQAFLNSAGITNVSLANVEVPVTSKGPQSIVWRPGTATTADHVETWAEVEAWFDALPASAPATVWCDDSLTGFGGLSIPGTAATDAQGRLWLANANQSPTGTSYITIVSGGHIDNLRGLAGLSIWAAPLSVSPLQFTTGTLSQFDIQGLGGLSANTATAVPILAASRNTTQIRVSEGASWYNGAAGSGVSLIGIAAGKALILDIHGAPTTAGATPALPAKLVSGVSGTTLSLNYDAETVFTPQTNFAGTLNLYRNTRAASADPSRGITSARPASPVAGEMYFDTTIGKPIWWTGAAWVLSTGAGA